MNIVNYLNPFSSGFAEAAQNYENLETGQKFKAVAAAVFAGIFSPFLLFTGSFAAFRFVVERYSKGTNPTSDKTNAVGTQTLPKPQSPQSSNRAKIAPIKLDSMVAPYDDYQLHNIKTVSKLHDAATAFKEKRKGLPNIHQQGAELGKNYYFQCNRGGGNCFYLGFTSGWGLVG